MYDPRVNYGNDTPIHRRYGNVKVVILGYMVEELIWMWIDMYGKEKVTPEFIEDELRKSILNWRHKGKNWDYFQVTNT
jgi:hypothetical protein